MVRIMNNLQLKMQNVICIVILSAAKDPFACIYRFFTSLRFVQNDKRHFIVDGPLVKYQLTCSQ